MKLLTKHFMLFELAAVASASALLGSYLYFKGGVLDLARVSDNITVLGTAAQVSSGLLGFIISAITFLFAFVDRGQFKLMRMSSSYVAFWKIFKSALIASGVCALLCIIGLCLAWLQVWVLFALWAVASSSILVFVRLCRVVWVLCRMIDAEVAQGALLRDAAEVKRP